MPNYPYGLGRGFGLPSGLPSTRAMANAGLRSSGNLVPAPISHSPAVIRPPRGPVIDSRGPMPVARAGGRSVGPARRMRPSIPQPTIIEANLVNRPLLGTKYAGRAVGIAATMEVMRRIVDEFSEGPPPPEVTTVRLPNSLAERYGQRITPMAPGSIDFGYTPNTDDRAKDKGKGTIKDQGIKPKVRHAPGQKEPQDVVPVGSKSQYEINLRGGSIFPLDVTIGKLAKFPVTVTGKLLKVGGSLLTEE